MFRILLVTLTILSLNSLTVLPEPIWAAVNAKEIIKKVKKSYQELHSLKADFEQVYVWELAGETQKLVGTLYLKSGNQYRIETDNQIIVTDGKTVWTYSKENDQVIIDLLSNSEENPLPKDLLFRYSEEYSPHLIGEEKIDGKRTYALNLIPKDEDAFVKSMKIWVDASNWLTVKIQQIDINDNVNTYLVKNVKRNIELDASLFNLEIPEGAEVVDLR